MYGDAMTTVSTIIAAMTVCLALSTALRAEQVWIAGDYSFSDELGGFEIVGVSGSGSEDDPFVVEQRLTELGPAVLVIRPTFVQSGWVDFRHNPFLRISVVAVITNASGRAWAGFDLELQEELGQPSVYRDGLSFDQLHTFDERLFASDKFALFTDLAEPYDRVRFEQGKVDHGETARFQMYITDVTPNQLFYLLQEPQLLMAGTVSPTATMLAAAGLPVPLN
jgi:hypothetical protein